MRQASSTAPNGLYGIRHARTKHNAEQRVRAWGDMALDETGKRSANDTGRMLQDKKIDCIYCSDLLRSMQTADILADWTKADIQVVPDLKPWHLGELTGKKISAVLDQLKYYGSHPDKQVPGGEAYRDFFNRFLKELEDLLEEAQRQAIAAVFHGKHTLALPTAIEALHGKKVDLTKIPVSNDWGPGAVLKITPQGEIEVLHMGEPEKSVS